MHSYLHHHSQLLTALLILISAGMNPKPAEIVVANLVRRKGSKPRTQKTLLSTLHDLFKKELSEQQLSQLFASLCSRGIVKVDGTKVSDALRIEPWEIISTPRERSAEVCVTSKVAVRGHSSDALAITPISPGGLHACLLLANKQGSVPKNFLITRYYPSGKRVSLRVLS